MADGRPGIEILPMTEEADWRWFQAYVKIPLAQDARGIIAFLKGVPAAGCVLQNWLPTSVEIHHVLANPMALRHGWLETLAEASLGESRLTVYSLVSEGREKAIKFDKHIGFKEVGRIPNGDTEGVDLVVLAVERHEFKYWKENSDGWRRRTRRT